jgi:hypothetical protein
MAIVVAAMALVGYDTWLWLFSAPALERITGLHLEAQVQVRILAADTRLASTPLLRIRIDSSLR